MRIKLALLLSQYFLISLSAWGQVLETINNLEKELVVTALHKQKAIKHNELAYVLLEIDLTKAHTHAQKALQIAQKQTLPTQEAESWWILGQIHRQQQQYSQSYQALQKALHIFRKERDILGVQKTHLEEAMLYSRQGLNPKADSILTKVLPILKSSYSRSFFYAYSYYCVGVHTLRKGDQIIAVENLMYALKLCGDKHDLLVARIQNAMGLAYKNLDFKRLALEHFLKALKIYDKLGIELRGLTVTLTNVGNLYVHWQDSLHYDVAFKYYKRAQKLAIKYQETEQYIDIMNNFARMYLAQKKYKFALTYLDSCQLLAQGKQQEFLLSLAHIKLQRADIYIRTNGTAKARKELWESIALYKQQQSMKDVAICYAFIGHSYRQEKEYTKAIAYYLQMEHLAKEGAFYKELSIAYSHLCNVYFEQKDCQNALQYALKKNAINEKHHLEPFKPDAWTMLAKADSCQGNYQSALKWYRRYVHYKDSADRNQRYQQTHELQHLYDFENQEKESFLLKRENTWQKRDLTNQLIMLVLACILLVFVGFISFISLYFYRYQKHKNLQIEARNQELEEANAFKTKLISIIAHDLRRPYTNLIGTLQLIREGALDAKEQQTLFTEIEKQTTRTNEFINNLLLWAKAQHNAFKFQPMLFDICLLSHHVLELLKHQAEEKEIRFCADMGQELYAYADIEMIKIVVFNLITNAIKFTPKKGSISISQEVNNNFAYIRIKDTGIGISPENQRKLLNKKFFYTSGTAGESGFGLGLMICYDFVAMNHGKLSFESDASKGTTFIIALPTQAEDAS